jgi:hypothetical protein
MKTKSVRGRIGFIAGNIAVSQTNTTEYVHERDERVRRFGVGLRPKPSFAEKLAKECGGKFANFIDVIPDVEFLNHWKSFKVWVGTKGVPSKPGFYRINRDGAKCTFTLFNTANVEQTLVDASKGLTDGMNHDFTLVDERTLKNAPSSLETTDSQKARDALHAETIKFLHVDSDAIKDAKVGTPLALGFGYPVYLLPHYGIYAITLKSWDASMPIAIVGIHQNKKLRRKEQ